MAALDPSSPYSRLSQDRFAALLGAQDQKRLGQSEKERSAGGQKGFKPNQPCFQPSRSDSGLLAIIGAVAKSLSKSGGLLKERLRSAAEFLSNQKAPTVEPVENYQLNRKNISRSQTKNSPDGCDGSYPEPTTNRFRCVPSLESKLASATPKIYTQLLTLPRHKHQIPRVRSRTSAPSCHFILHLT